MTLQGTGSAVSYDFEQLWEGKKWSPPAAFYDTNRWNERRRGESRSPCPALLVILWRGFVSKTIFHAAPHITHPKDPGNEDAHHGQIAPKHRPRNTRNRPHTGKLSRMNYFIAFQYILSWSLRFPFAAKWRDNWEKEALGLSRNLLRSISLLRS